MDRLATRARTHMGAVVVAVLVVAGLAGCRSGDVAGGSPGPTQTVEAFMHALGAKDPDAACAQVSTGGKRLADAALDQCKEGLQKVLAEVNDPSELTRLSSAKVTGATVNGDRATVKAAQIVGVPQGYQNDVDLVRIGGSWFIDSKS